MSGNGLREAPPVFKLLRDSGAVITYRSELDDGTSVVIKRLVEAAARNDDAGRLRFRREQRFARLLRHSSLPRLVDEGDDWIAFDGLEDSVAKPAIAARYRTPMALRRLLAPLADALAFVHARGIVHRDIKPAHVMFCGGRPVLIDFGIAGPPEDRLAAVELSGTPAWMAPEQLAGQQAHSASDVWSLSALAAFLATGTRPYSGEAEAVISRRLAGEPPAFDLAASALRTDPSLAELIERGLGPPQNRPPAAAFVSC